MARVPDLREIADTHGLKLVTIRDLIAYRMRTETLVQRVVEVDMPTAHGDFQLSAYEETLTGDVHLALTKGGPFQPDQPGADARPQPVRHRRHLRLGAVRLRRTTRRGDGPD